MVASRAITTISPAVDPISHIVLGASLGYAAFGRRLGRTAALAGGLAAFVPDVDVFIRSATDPLLAIEHHRGFTHSLFFAPLGAAVVASLWLLRPGGRGRWLALWGCALVAYHSHCLLDAATSYGTHLLWPFSDVRFGWDLISIIDPPFTLALAAGLFLALKRRSARPAVVGLSLAAVYLGCGAVQHARAGATQRQFAAARGHNPERVELMPTLANNIVWRALYIHEGRIHSDRIRVGWFSAPTVREGWSLPLVQEKDLTAGERMRNDARRPFQRFQWFSEGWVARSPGDPTLLGDMRYSLSGDAFDPIWGIRFTPPDAPNDVVWVNHTRDRQVRPAELWNEIAGRDARYVPAATLRPSHQARTSRAAGLPLSAPAQGRTESLPITSSTPPGNRPRPRTSPSRSRPCRAHTARAGRPDFPLN
jgi:inner membrane protein